MLNESIKMALQGMVSNKLRTFLTARAVVFDFEYPNAFTANEDNFYDGFHLQGPQKQLLIDVIFGNASFDCVRISRPTT